MYIYIGGYVDVSCLGSCASGWMDHETDYCYQVINDPSQILTWSDAMQRCQNMGANLMTINVYVLSCLFLWITRDRKVNARESLYHVCNTSVSEISLYTIHVLKKCFVNIVNLVNIVNIVNLSDCRQRDQDALLEIAGQLYYNNIQSVRIGVSGKIYTTHLYVYKQTKYIQW